MNLDCSQLKPPFDDPMCANESARQAGSNDTIPDPSLEISCFTVSRLVRGKGPLMLRGLLTPREILFVMGPCKLNI